MFDSLRNLGSMAGIMKDLPRIKARMEEVRRQSEILRVAASSGGGAVTAVASGRGRIESLTVEPHLLIALGDARFPEQRALATELIREAVNASLERAQAAVAENLAQAARDLNLPISPEQLKELM